MLLCVLTASQWGGGGRCACFTVAFADAHAAQLEQYEVSLVPLIHIHQCICYSYILDI